MNENELDKMEAEFDRLAFDLQQAYNELQQAPDGFADLAYQAYQLALDAYYRVHSELMKRYEILAIGKEGQTPFLTMQDGEK